MDKFLEYHWLNNLVFISYRWSGPRDVESLKTFVLEEAEKAAMKAEVDGDKEL